MLTITANSEQVKDTDTFLKQKISSICVEGVIYDDKNPLAVINRQSVSIGEKFSDFTVIAIEKNSVTFAYENITFKKEIGQDCKETTFTKSLCPRKNISNENKKTLITTKSATVHKKVSINNVISFLNFLVLLIILIYVYSSVSLQIIAKKTSTKYSWFAWIPIMNLVLMCLISRRSLWWLLTILVPFGIIIFLVVTGINICELRNKPWWLAIFFILPPFNLFLLGYLAFSK